MLYLETVAGLVLLLAAAEFLVRGSVALASLLGVRPAVIGLTVVALGTSAPELMVSLDAALRGVPDMALGNVIGSNIANVLLILGAAALFWPIRHDATGYRADSLIMLAGSGVFMACLGGGTVARWQGLLLFALLLGFLAWSYWRERRHRAANPMTEEAREMAGYTGSRPVAALTTVFGLAGVVLGAELLVNGGAGLARLYGVPESVIGLTLIAFGTSLPELATSVVAALRHHSDVAIGNVVGSNLFNVLGVAGLVAMVSPLPVPGNLVAVDMWVMLGASALLLPFLLRHRLTRAEGGLFLALYCGYVAWQYAGPGAVPLHGAAG